MSLYVTDDGKRVEAEEEEEYSSDESFPEETFPDESPFPVFSEFDDLPVEVQMRKRVYYNIEQELYFSGNEVLKIFDYMPPTKVARYDEEQGFVCGCGCGGFGRYEDFHEEDIRNQQLKNAPDKIYEEDAQLRGKNAENAQQYCEEYSKQYNDEDAELYDEVDVNVERDQPTETEDFTVSKISELPKKVAKPYLRLVASILKNTNYQQTTEEKCEKAPTKVLILSSTEPETLNKDQIRIHCEMMMKKILAAQKLNIDELKERRSILFFNFRDCTAIMKLVPKEEPSLADDKAIQAKPKEEPSLADDEAIQAKQLSMITKCRLFFEYILRLSGRIHTKAQQEETRNMIKEVMDGKLKYKKFVKILTRNPRYPIQITPEVIDLKTALPLLRKSFAEKGLCELVKEQKDTVPISAPQTRPALNIPFFNCVLQYLWITTDNTGGVETPCTI